MNCPACTNTILVMSERQGVEIDYCPHCRGVWLDRGELDKLVERAVAPPPRRDEQRGPDHRHEPGAGQYHRNPRSQKSWLADIFD